MVYSKGHRNCCCFRKKESKSRKIILKAPISACSFVFFSFIAFFFSKEEEVEDVIVSLVRDLSVCLGRC